MGCKCNVQPSPYYAPVVRPCYRCLFKEVERLKAKLLEVTEEFEDYKLNQLGER